MFLNQLTAVEKEAFISLSVQAAKANGILATEEYVMIEEYCREMGIPSFDTENIKSMDEIVEVFQKSSERNKKIVLLEILGLVFSDGEYDTQEKTFIYDYAKKIGLTETDIVQQTELIKKYLAILNDITKAIDGK